MALAAAETLAAVRIQILEATNVHRRGQWLSTGKPQTFTIRLDSEAPSLVNWTASRFSIYPACRQPDFQDSIIQANQVTPQL